MRKKIFLKSRFWHFFCTKKITFWFILPRKMHKFRVLRAILKSKILKKMLFLKIMVLKKKNIFKKRDFEEKIIFNKHDFEWKSFCKKHDFHIKIFRPVRFRMNFLTTWFLWFFHIWYKVLSSTCYIFLPLYFFHWFSQVVTNFTFTSETYVILLLLKCLPSNATK